MSVWSRDGSVEFTLVLDENVMRRCFIPIAERLSKSEIFADLFLITTAHPCIYRNLHRSGTPWTIIFVNPQAW